MTSLRSTVARRFGHLVAEAPGAPAAEFTFAPITAEEAAAVLDLASEHRLTVLPWGGGTHQVDPLPAPDVVVSTAGLAGVDWRPDDLTVVVGAGVAVADLEGRLAAQGQSAILPEAPGAGSVGGAVAAAASPWRRLRFGPIRDRVLEVVAATGDGRVIRAGGQVVKNVTGYDIPRLYAGSRGALGIVTRLCLKLWPQGAASATVAVDDAEAAVRIAQRPLAVLQTLEGAVVYLGGTAAEVEAQAAALGGSVRPGLLWPERPRGRVEVVVRVPPARVGDAVRRIAPARFVATHGVGEVFVAGDLDGAQVAEWRSWAESQGGSVVIERGAADLGLDPWGTPPGTLALQRRIKAAFDPIGIMVPGRLPGGL